MQKSELALSINLTAKTIVRLSTHDAAQGKLKTRDVLDFVISTLEKDLAEQIEHEKPKKPQLRIVK